MTSSIFGNRNPLMGAVSMAKQMANGNPQGLFGQMMQSNPQFRAFVEQNKGKTPQQVARENGVDLSQLGKF